MDFIFDPSLVLYVPLHQLDGSSIQSQDAYGHLCTVTGASWRPNGRYFDGVDDKISILDHASLDITGSLTLMAWCYHDLPNNDFIVSKWGATDNSYSLLEAAGQKLLLEIRVSNAAKQVLSDNVLPAATWTLCTGVYNKTDLRVYQNASLDCTPVVQTGNIDNTAENVYVGWGYNNNYAWSGKIGEVWIYNRALTPLEIQHNYLATKERYK